VGRNRQAVATLDASRARRTLLETDVRVQIERARRGIISATAAVRISQATVVNARERLRLATGRYQTSVGTALEVRDAQLAYLAAAASGVQAQFDLSVERAQLLRTLGRAY
jgi:outer membrane protein TolC